MTYSRRPAKIPGAADKRRAFAAFSPPTKPERTSAIVLYLVNPRNPLVGLTDLAGSRWNRYRVWRPLGLMTVAALTPREWNVTIFDENIRTPDYRSLPRPDLVGITAFTSQASRAYQIAADFRRRGVPVVMGGIHASMCVDEARGHVDSVVAGEAEPVWSRVLADAQRRTLLPVYTGGNVDLTDVPHARHDMLMGDYAFGSIQTSRGCPLNCSFCSVTAFNGHRYRLRPVEDVVREFGAIRERRVLIVDDNLIGTRRDHIERAKSLFLALIRANLRKKWIAQATINMADDEELLALAARAGCVGVFVGFESPTLEGLREIGKKVNILKDRNYPAAVRRIQRHGILVAGSFIMGLDSDTAGIGRQIARAAARYGVDMLNTLFLTPLPGTRLWDELKSQGRLVTDRFPEDWGYYTLTYPVADYKNLSRAGIIREMEDCEGRFYSLWRIVGRAARNVWKRRSPWTALVANLSFRANVRLGRRMCREFESSRAARPAG